jgi:hypothetical protein
MKKLILMFYFVSLSLICFSQLRDSVKINSPIFEIMYSETYKEPLWVKYTVLCPNGQASRAGLDFYTNDSVKTTTNSDYSHNEWDKGHMAPAADFNCTLDMLKQTFSYLNCTLQNQYLNRGVWKSLEIYERELALKETVNIYIKVEFKNPLNKLPSGAVIPSGFYKYITLVKSNKTLVYYFPNTKPTKLKYSDYQVK